MGLLGPRKDPQQRKGKKNWHVWKAEKTPKKERSFRPGKRRKDVLRLTGGGKHPQKGKGSLGHLNSSLDREGKKSPKKGG